MSPDTDPAIRSLLDEVPVPDHADGFWAALRDDLAAGSGGPVAIDSVRRRGTPDRAPGRWRLAAAAVALVLAGAAAFLTTRDDAPVPVTSDPDEVPAPDVSALPDGADGALVPDGHPVALDGTHVVGVSPDGRWLYVSGPHPGGGQGCEGQLRRALYVQSAGGEGERRLLGRADQPIDATGATRMAFGPDGSVAALTVCESFVADLFVGTLGESGEIDDPVDVAVDEINSILDLEWSSADTLLATTYGLGTDAPDGRALIEISVAGNAPTTRTLPQSGLLSIDVLSDGTLVSRDNVGTVRVGDEEIGSEGQIFDVVASPDDRFVVTAAASGVTAYDLETGASERLSDRPAYEAEFLDTGDLVVQTRDDRNVVRIESIRLGTVGTGDHDGATIAEVEAEGRVVTAVPAPDGSRIWISYRADDESLVLLEQPLTR